MMGRATIAVAAAIAIVAPSGAVEPTFRFQNNFWVNLHHVLRGEARRRNAQMATGVRADALTEGERAAWTSALDGYADNAKRDLLFDDSLRRITNALASVTNELALDPMPAAIDGATSRALTRAAPIYRAHYWSAQRQLNDRWIAALQPMIAAHGSAMSAAIARTYRVEWPAAPIVVDAAAEAGPNGAYTIDGPDGTAAHTIVEAANPEYQGDMAFEMVFHEASHAGAIGGRIIAAIDAEAARQHVTAPRDLWHTVIFYTAGELARRELGKTGDAHYQPYAYRYGIYTRGWQPLRDALERDWQPYLDGRIGFAEALGALVHDSLR
jgi:hypothetical protein